MIGDRKVQILIDCLKGRVRLNQLINLIKYVLGPRREIVLWQPVYLEVYTTTRCNLSCDMCLTHSTKHNNIYGQKPLKDMDFETFKNFLNTFKKSLVVSLVGCGEPLFNKDFFKMAEYAAKDMKMYASTTTNGTLINQYKAQIVNSSLDLLQVSVNGYNADDYTRLTGMPGEYFDSIINNIAELIKARDSANKVKPEIAVSFILDNKNYKFIREMVSLAERLSVDEIVFFHFISSPQSGFTPQERCIFSDNAEAIEEIRRVKMMKSKARIKVLLRPLDRILCRREYELKNCCGPFYSISVDGEGNIGACNCILLDNSNNGKFYDKDVWNGPYFREFRSRFINPDKPVFEPCGWCNNNSSCYI